MGFARRDLTDAQVVDVGHGRPLDPAGPGFYAAGRAGRPSDGVVGGRAHANEIGGRRAPSDDAGQDDGSTGRPEGQLPPSPPVPPAPPDVPDQ